MTDSTTPSPADGRIDRDGGFTPTTTDGAIENLDGRGGDTGDDAGIPDVPPADAGDGSGVL